MERKYVEPREVLAEQMKELARREARERGYVFERQADGSYKLRPLEGEGV